MDTFGFDKKYTIKNVADYPADFDFSTNLEKRPDGTTVKIEYTKMLNGDVLETESIVNQDSNPIKVPPKSTPASKKNTRKKKRKKRTKKNNINIIHIMKPVLVTLVAVTLVFILSCTVIAFVKKNGSDFKSKLTSKLTTVKKSVGTDIGAEDTPTGDSSSEDTTEEAENTVTVTAVVDETENGPLQFHPHPVESTMPSNLVESTSVCVDDVILKGGSYQAPEEISFGLGTEYFQGEGVITFRGNNFRSEPTYGCAEMTQHALIPAWSVATGSLSQGDAVWTGSGWTGQPLMQKWSREQKLHMNMYDWAKENDNLVEVIYACMDGNIYFMDLKTGEKTRDTMSLGFTFKGSGALDPRGYPILYLGAGYEGSSGHARVFIINLFDCTVMHTFGNDDPFSLRGTLSYFDSSALVDAETDTLIYPGENGILYLMHLGTKYNEENGSLSIDPSHVVKWHCKNKRTRVEAFWPGMEDSAVIYKGYLYIMDNGGNFYCLNLNTMELVWVQDCLDDSNGSPVLSIEDGKAYLYASTSFHLGWRSADSAAIPIWKLDAETGEVVWQVNYICQSMEDLSGGVQSTIALGRNNLKDNIYVTVSRTGGMYNGVLACIDKKTGTRKWEHNAAYTWSSPICVYNSAGEGSILYCNSGGVMYLLNGTTGDVYASLKLSENNIEASPAVYKNYVVVGGRACKIWGILLQ